MMENLESAKFEKFEKFVIENTGEIRGGEDCGNTYCT
jgi:hypothetical protein